MNPIQPEPKARPTSTNGATHGKALVASTPSTSVSRRVETNPLLMSDEQWKRLELVSERAVKSGVLPKGIDSPAKAFIVALKGVELGLQPMYALEHIVVINGKATIDGQAMLRLILERCPGAKVECVTAIEKQMHEHEVVMTRPGQKPQHFRFTLDDAKRAGLFEKAGPWKQYPKAMLKWRAISDGARTVFPDIIGGLYLPEELGAPVNEDGQIIEANFTLAEPVKGLGLEAAKNEETVVSEGPEGVQVGNNGENDGVEVGNDDVSISTSAEGTASAETVGGWNSPESQKQALRLLDQTAKNSGWSKMQLRDYVDFELNKHSAFDLTWAELNQLLKHVERNRKDGKE